MLPLEHPEDIDKDFTDLRKPRVLFAFVHMLLICVFQLKSCAIVTRVLQKVLSLGSDYFSATFYQTYFYYKPSKYSPFTETHFCNLFAQSRKADSLLLVSVGDTDK